MSSNCCDFVKNTANNCSINCQLDLLMITSLMLRYDMKRGTILCLQILLSFAAAASDVHYEFRQFLSEEAFSNENVRSIFQDSRGYVWMGVDSEGLCKYDGSRIEIFGHQSSENTSISSNYINDIQEDLHGNIWLATERGLNVFNKITREFEKIQLGEKRIQVVNTIVRSSDGSMIVGAEDGAYRIMPSFSSTKGQSPKLTFEFVDNVFTEKFEGIAVTTIISESTDTFWLGSRSGLYRYSFGKNEMLHWSKSSQAFSLSDNEINSMARLDEDRLIIGSDDGVNVFNTKTNVFCSVKIKDSGIFNDGQVGIISVFKDSNNVVWIGTTTYGIITGKIIESNCGFESFEMEIPASIAGLTSNYITDITEDKNHQIWVATKFGGIYIYDQRRSTFPRFSLDKATDVTDQDQSFIISADQDQNGNIWIGTRDRGLVKYNPADGKFKDYPLWQDAELVRRVETIFCEDANVVWLGNKRGLIRLDSKTGQDQYVSFPKVLCMAKDNEGLLWVGTRNGLFKFDPANGNVLPHESTHSDFFRNTDLSISRLMCDLDGVLWVGTDNEGLFRYEMKSDSLRQFKQKENKTNSISGNAIRSIFRDSKSRLWVGTKSSGLNLYDGDNEFSCFNEKSGLPSNTIFSIMEDAQENLWIATNKGLSRFNNEKKEFVNFTSRHGLQGNIFEKYASLRLNDGRMFVAGNNGFNIFDPAAIKLEDYMPPLVITLVTANSDAVGRDIFSNQEIQLDYFQNLLTFEFSSLDYRDVSAIQYRYKLAGVDATWIDSGNKNQVTYSNLKHGKHQFLLQATNADGVWNDQELSLVINIDTPPWRTWYAQIIYGLFTLASIYFIYWLANVRTNYLHRLQTKELELRQSNELNQLKLNFFTNISHELRTPLTLILAPLEKLRKTNSSAEVNKSVHQAYRSARQLLQLTDQLMYFRKVESGGLPLKVSEGDLTVFIDELIQPFYELASAKEISLEVHLENAKSITWFDQDKIERVVSNILINAFKFTSAHGTIAISLQFSAREDQNAGAARSAIISVRDTGEGIAEAEIEHIFDRYYQAGGIRAGNGIGLELVKSLVQKHKGFIQAESEIGVGTKFTVQIPIDKDAYLVDEIFAEDKSQQVRDPYQISDLLPIEIQTEKSERQASKLEYKLLIVEDNEELSSYLRDSLEQDFTIESVSDGEDALSRIADFSPDVVLSDVMMPNMDGLELCRNLKENIITSHIPVVLLTARNLEEHQVEGFESGADAYVVKPFDVDVLRARLKTLVGNRKKLLGTLRESMVFEPVKVSSNSVDVQFIARIIEIMQQNFTNVDFNVEEFAHVVHMSRSQLFRKMKSLTGQTPSEYLYAFRIKKAIELLNERQANVSEIAYQTGFSTPNSFSKTFAKYVGVSPRRYMSQIQSA
jgi:signal transduction histidine kinase/ligand-binding sensor domain-containing protein/DNA-binding response OmpR family regulator